MTIGPHEGRELALMKAGKKPLSMFVVEPDIDIFPEAEFDALVSECALTKRVQDEGEFRRVLYALPGEERRIEAMLLVMRVYRLYSGWSPDLERVIGALLGYEHGDVEAFIKKISDAAATFLITGDSQTERRTCEADPMRPRSCATSMLANDLPILPTPPTFLALFFEPGGRPRRFLAIDLPS